MKLLIIVFVIIILLLYMVIRKQRELIDRLEREKIEEIKRCKLKYSIAENISRILYFSQNMEMVEVYMKNQGINRIAVYGMGKVGKRFVEQMKKTDIHICYGIDKANICADIEVRKPEEVENDMDIIIVTAETYYFEIREIMKTKVEVPIVLLSQFLDEIRLTAYVN